MSTNRRLRRFSIIGCVAIAGFLMPLPVGAADIVHRYDFEDEDGSDSVGNVDGFVEGAPEFTNDAVSGNRSVTLFGSEYVLVDEPMDFGAQFSIALWVLPDSTALGIQNLIGNSVGGFDRDGFKMFYNTWTADSSTADGKLILETGDDVTGVATAGEVGAVSEEVWTHIAAALDVDAGAANLYVDGEFYASGSINSSMTTESPFEIGRMMGAWDLHGSMDDVQIYSGVLTDEEAEWLFNNPGAVLGDPVDAALQAGDADMNLEFNQLDLVMVQVAAKYLTGEAATWGEGDWNGAPGGSVGNPPNGDGLFNQIDIIAALDAGLYLTGPYAAVGPDGTGDGNATIVYDPADGTVAVEAGATALTSINIDSAASIFTGEPAQNLGGSFDNDADNNIFKATFGDSFGSLSFGKVAQPGLNAEFLQNDLTVVGSLLGGGDLGVVDVRVIPEPSSMILLALGIAAAALLRRRRRS